MIRKNCWILHIIKTILMLFSIIAPSLIKYIPICSLVHLNYACVVFVLHIVYGQYFYVISHHIKVI